MTCNGYPSPSAVFEDKRVCLHPYHGSVKSRIRAVPLQMGAGAGVARFLATSAAADGFQGAGVPIMVGDGMLRTKHSRHGGTLSVPLMHAEVAHVPIIRSGSRTPMTLIAVVPHSSDEESDGNTGAWLMVCKTSQVTEILRGLGALGVMRDDFSGFYETKDDSIGVGSFSTVKIANARGSSCGNDQVAVKWMNQRASASNILKEVEMLVEAQCHQNIVGFHGVFCKIEEDSSAPADMGGLQMMIPQAWALVFDKLDGGDLYDFISHNGALTDVQAQPLFFDLVSALAHLHEKGMVHRDVKPENILLNCEGRAVLTDFGLAAHENDEVEMVRRCGSLGYIAPETLKGLHTTCKADCFSAGTVLYFMLTSTTPFFSKDQPSSARKTVKCKINLNKIPDYKAGEDCKDMLARVIVLDIEERLSAADMLRHPYICDVARASHTERHGGLTPIADVDESAVEECSITIFAHAAEGAAAAPHVSDKSQQQQLVSISPLDSPPPRLSNRWVPSSLAEAAAPLQIKSGASSAATSRPAVAPRGSFGVVANSSAKGVSSSVVESGGVFSSASSAPSSSPAGSVSPALTAIALPKSPHAPRPSNFFNRSVPGARRRPNYLEGRHPSPNTLSAR